MHAKVYKKGDSKNIRKIVRFAGLGVAVLGIVFGLYVFFPFLSWEFYIKPVFASQSFASPIPKTTVITQDYIRSLLQSTTSTFNSQGWLPPAYKETQVTEQMSKYTISIPKIGVESAEVSTVDNDLSRHLVHFPGTATPPNVGNAAIFGHSTLPQLYNPRDYKTIFANAHTLKVGNTILVTANNTLYTYKIVTVSIVDAEDTSYLTQDTDGSYLTIITCTPPGTIWKRLIIKAKLE